jgi:hypothetical protein
VGGASRVSKSTVAAAMFCLALAKVGHVIPLRLMAAVIALARAHSLVKSMVATYSIPNEALRRCSSVSWALMVGSPIIRHQLAGRGLALVVPLGKLAVVRGGAPFLDEAPWSTP